MKIEVVRAWPRRHASRVVEVGEGATVREAIEASGLDASGTSGQAVFGVRVDPDQRLCDGDRIELLEGLQADPKDARRRRASGQAKK